MLIDNITDGLDNGNKCIGIFLDLKKAFDTVSIPLLLKKLELLGLRGLPLAWFSSYLTGRKQFVRLEDDVISDTESISFGVPQGSVLGPTLFLVYINELCRLDLGPAKIVTFADDTAIIFKGRTWTDVKRKTELGMRLVSNWLIDNLLTLNTLKTKFIAFHITNRTAPDRNIVIKIHDNDCDNTSFCTCKVIDRTEHIKYLGVIVDENLRWQRHIDYICDRSRKILHVFKKLRYAVDAATLKSIYFALGQSILTYCIAIWGGTAKTTLIKLERAQRTTLKVMYNKPFRFSTQELYREIQVLSIRQLYIQKILLRFHRTALSTMRVIENDKIKRHVPGRFRPWNIPKTKTNFACRSPYYMEPFLYTRVNNVLLLSNMTRSQCKSAIFKWLVLRDYNDTESLLNNGVT